MWAFIAGVLLGTIIGFIGMGLCIGAAEAEEDVEIDRR